MTNTKLKKEKLVKFLIKEGPRLLPWIGPLAGDVWKDAVEEFTELRWISIQRTPRQYPF
ncbi:MAG: hypothetical protein HXY36_05540 [Chloroflexi bacterium]|nr:hypothetical protein [Chloroflexota bacterium]